MLDFFFISAFIWSLTLLITPGGNSEVEVSDITPPASSCPFVPMLLSWVRTPANLVKWNK